MFLSKIWFILIALVAGVAGDVRAHRAAARRAEAGRARGAAPRSRAVRRRADVQGRRAQVDRPRLEAGTRRHRLRFARRGVARLGRVGRAAQDAAGPLPRAHPRPRDGRHRDAGRHRQQGPRRRARGRQRQGVRRLHRRRRGGRRRAARLPVGRRLGHERRQAACASRRRRCCRRTATASWARSTWAPRPATALVERLKKNLDVDVALLLRGKVIASSRPAGQLVALPELIGQHAKEIEEVKRTPAMPLTAGQDSLLAVAAPFPGQAGQQQAYYALMGMQPAKSDLRSLLSNTSSDDLKWGNFPVDPAGGRRARHDRRGPVHAAPRGRGPAREAARRAAAARARRDLQDPGQPLRRPTSAASRATSTPRSSATRTRRRRPRRWPART